MDEITDGACPRCTHPTEEHGPLGCSVGGEGWGCMCTWPKPLHIQPTELEIAQMKADRNRGFAMFYRQKAIEQRGTIANLAAALRTVNESLDDLKMHELKLDVAPYWTSVPTVEWEQAIERANAAIEPVRAWLEEK